VPERGRPSRATAHSERATPEQSHAAWNCSRSTVFSNEGTLMSLGTILSSFILILIASFRLPIAELGYAPGGVVGSWWRSWLSVLLGRI